MQKTESVANAKAEFGLYHLSTEATLDYIWGALDDARLTHAEIADIMGKQVALIHAFARFKRSRDNAICHSIRDEFRKWVSQQRSLDWARLMIGKIDLSGMEPATLKKLDELL